MREWALLCSHWPRTPFRCQGPWEPWNKVAGEQQDLWGSRVVGEFVDAMTLVEHGSHDWADWAQSTMAEAVDIK